MAYLGLSILDGPPRTVQLEIDDWQNTSWGLHAIDRRRISCEVAIASDGSRMNRCDYEALSHYLIPNGRHRYHTIYLRPPNKAYEIDDVNHVANGVECDCTWNTETLKQTHPECTGAAQALLTTPKRIGTEQMAGHRVVRYREDDDVGTPWKSQWRRALAAKSSKRSEPSEAPSEFREPVGSIAFLIRRR